MNRGKLRRLFEKTVRKKAVTDTAEKEIYHIFLKKTEDFSFLSCGDWNGDDPSFPNREQAYFF